MAENKIKIVPAIRSMMGNVPYLSQTDGKAINAPHVAIITPDILSPNFIIRQTGMCQECPAAPPLSYEQRGMCRLVQRNAQVVHAYHCQPVEGRQRRCLTE